MRPPFRSTSSFARRLMSPTAFLTMEGGNVNAARGDHDRAALPHEPEQCEKERERDAWAKFLPGYDPRYDTVLLAGKLCRVAPILHDLDSKHK